MDLESSEKTFNILSIDGGGIRGIVPAHILCQLFDDFNLDPLKHFDLIAGTSTGSIIAAGIASEKNIGDIVKLYEENGKDIFSPMRTRVPSWPKSLRPAIHSVYENSNLAAELNKVFGEKTLGEIAFPLMLPSTDISNGCVHVFKSGYSSQFTRDKDVRVQDAVLASCSAPTYFDPVQVGDYQLSDGGLWANNPALSATIEAIHRQKISIEKIRVLSVGTGHSRVYYPKDKDKNWGLATGWGIKDFISFILSLQSQVAQNQLSLMLSPDQLLRLDFDSDKPLPLDDASTTNQLISRADKLYTHKKTEIKKFLETC